MEIIWATGKKIAPAELQGLLGEHAEQVLPCSRLGLGQVLVNLSACQIKRIIRQRLAKLGITDKQQGHQFFVRNVGVFAADFLSGFARAIECGELRLSSHLITSFGRLTAIVPTMSIRGLGTERKGCRAKNKPLQSAGAIWANCV